MAGRNETRLMLAETAAWCLPLMRLTRAALRASQRLAAHAASAAGPVASSAVPQWLATNLILGSKQLVFGHVVEPQNKRVMQEALLAEADCYCKQRTDHVA